MTHSFAGVVCGWLPLAWVQSHLLAIMVLLAEVLLVITPIIFRVEKEKYHLFVVLMHVPATVTKRLHAVAQTGYNRMNSIINSDVVGSETVEPQDEEVRVPRGTILKLMMLLIPPAQAVLGRRGRATPRVFEKKLQ